MHNPNSLVDVNQLLALMERDDVVLIDFSQEPNQLIPGAVWVNRSLLLRDFEGNTMAPQPLEVHEHVLGHLGISNDHTIVIYCNQHNLWATRLLWQLRAMGHERVKLLDGGTSAWLAAGGTVSNVPSAPRAPVEFRALNRMGFIHADLADVLDAKHNPNWIIIDFRTQPEWDAGRIPSAVQFTFPADIRNADGTFRSAEEVAYLFRDIPRDKRIIVYCAGGTRAASIWFALTDILGWPQRVLLYEGWWNYAWSGLPIEI
jgi:thiosulfate/3-mercaptopyruvate sulfurtransferase